MVRSGDTMVDEAGATSTGAIDGDPFETVDGRRRSGRPSSGPADRLISAALGPQLAAALVLVAVVLWWLLRSLDPASPGVRQATSIGVAVALAALGALIHLLARAARANGRLAVELERVAAQASIDELTGLANRHGIAADIDRRLATREPGDLVGVLFCDLDRLRVVNDSLGHAAGDEVLAVAARRLSSVVRQVDSVGRFGGDEFVVVTAGLPAIRDLEILAARLTDALREPTVLADGTAQVVSGSIGIAVVVGDATFSSGDLLRDAAVATDQAKQQGGDRYTVFDRTQRAEAVARLALEQELRAGLRRGEIVVHYQPIVDCGTGMIDRLEALIRWDHPVRGTVLPSDFLPVAAESHLIVQLGRIVLSEACGQAVAWSAATGRRISVAVNVGERQLLDLGLVDTVTRVLAETGLPAGQLELEVTEELILDRLDRSLVVLRQLDLLGVRLAIDDFGTSQASLGRLKQLAMVSTLKIDRLFVEDIATDPVDAKIVAAIVALATTVGMSVVAEGVETAEQARVLADLGVEHLQGFLFQRPARADVIETALRDQHRDRW